MLLFLCLLNLHCNQCVFAADGTSSFLTLSVAILLLLPLEWMMVMYHLFKPFVSMLASIFQFHSLLVLSYLFRSLLARVAIAR
jgi:hypothetical protein